MPFSNSRDADIRLTGDNSPLSTEDVRGLMPHLRQISEGGMRRLCSELYLQNLLAVQRFDRSSKRLSWVVISFTVVLVALTGVLTYYTFLLAQR